MDSKLRLRLKRALKKLLHNRWFPDRKAIATGTSGILAFYLGHLLHLTPDTALAAVTAVTSITAWIVPHSVTDLTRTADLVITDVSGKVTDLMWKFDREKGEMRRHITKGNSHDKAPTRQVKDDIECSKSDSVADKPSGIGAANECRCSRSQDKRSVRSKEPTETSGGNS